ncbi:MAG TPA: hypothetical protein VK427_18770 [Kofleriaceae bacterium]|nr:hypothetical protein [Kofleriaceae bacterium]
MLGWLLILWRFLAVYAWLGGPLYAFDLLKNGDDDLRVLVICSLPVALVLVGSFGLDFTKPARFLVRIGMFGAVALLLLDAFATLCYLFYWPGYREPWLVLSGLAAGFVAALGYLVLARTYLARMR